MILHNNRQLNRILYYSYMYKDSLHAHVRAHIKLHLKKLTNKQKLNQFSV